MIKTIIFDLGGVIVPFDFDRAYRRLEPLTSLTTREMRGRIAATDLVLRFETGKIEPNDFVGQLSGLLGVKLDYGEFCELWSSIFLPETLIPESLLQGLKRRYRLLLLSNTNAIHFQMIRGAYPLLRHMDHFVLSYEAGAMKPAPEIYREAIRHAQCDPGECFFTDDIPAFVEAARKEGIDAVEFRGLEQLEADFSERGITAG